MISRFYQSYLPYKFHYWFWILCFFLLLVFNFIFIFGLIVLYLLTFFLFRKLNPLLKEEPLNNNEVLYSPVNGKVTHIRKQLNHEQFGGPVSEIRIIIPWWKEYGVYLPKTSEIKELIYKPGKSHFRYGWKNPISFSPDIPPGQYLELETIQGEILGLHFSSCPLGMHPHIHVLPGDRGKNIANIGFFPFGGTLHFYFPENFEILVQEGQNISACETLIAGTIENR